MRSSISATASSVAWRRLSVLAAPLLLFAGSGCGEGAATVSGEVKIDGVPVQNGAITFEPADKNGPTMGGPIINGRYEVTGKPGKKVVLVTASIPTGKKIPAGSPAPPGTMVDEVRIFPPTGRSHEVKEVELQPGPNTFSVQLTTPPGGPITPGGGPTGGPTGGGPSGPSGPSR